eukprot:gene20815-32086_t
MASVKRKAAAVAASAVSSKRAKVAAAAVPAAAAAAAAAEPPVGWKKMWAAIEKMRKQQIAPVDEMGCDKLTDKKMAPAVVRYQALIGLMLSSQTRDQQTAATMAILRNHGLTPTNIASTSEDELKDLIKSVGFFNNKAKYIKHTTNILLEEYNGDTPDTLKDVLKLPGVGPKMGHLFLQVAYNKTEGIGVDVHVHRLSNRYGWVNTKTPEQTRKALEAWLP